MLCKVMGVNRSGYYKWRKRQGTANRYLQDRRLLTELILERHQKHKVWGYHSIAASIRNDTGWKVSDNLVHKCCKAVGVRSKAKRYKYRKPGEENEIFPNLVRGRWIAAKPLEIVVSDMTWGVSQILCKHRRAVNNRAKIIYWGDGLSATP